LLREYPAASCRRFSDFRSIDAFAVEERFRDMDGMDIHYEREKNISLPLAHPRVLGHIAIGELA
jgi:hypothetical protein